MNPLFEFIETNDGLTLLFALLVLWMIGTRAMQSFPDRLHWGRRAAYLTLLSYVGSQVLSGSAWDANDLMGYLFRGLAAAGYVCSLTWIVLPVVWSLHQTIRGLSRRTVAEPWRKLRQRASESRRRSDEELRRQQDRLEAERLKPQRDREAAERSQLALEYAVRTREEKRRREDARLAVILLWQQHSRTLSAIFPRDQLEALLAVYSSDAEPVEEAERRCQQLTETLQQCLRNAGVSDRPPFQTFTEVADHFERRGSEIQNSALSQEEKDALLSALNEEKSQSIGQFLQRQH